MKHRLMLDFDSSEAMGDFLEEFLPLLSRHIPFAPGVFKADALDYKVKRANTYILGNADEPVHLERFEVTRKKVF